MALHVHAPGPFTTVQDLGRPGLAHLGVGRSGAADLPAHRLANRLIGNAEDAATLELTLGGLRVSTDAAAWVVLTGASAPAHTGDGPVAPDTPAYLPAGATLSVGMPVAGLRTYLAVRGGVAVAAVLGSRSTDVLSGIGPPPLRAGDTIPIGPATEHWQPVDHVPLAGIDEVPVLELSLGPREDWVADDALDTLAATTWRVSPDSNRVGIRLVGPPLPRSHSEELPSEGMVAGAVQVPPDGQPIIFLADHPVTGGYPVIGVLTDAAVALAAQLRPGGSCQLRVRERPPAFADLRRGTPHSPA